VGLPEAAEFSVKAMQGWNKELGTNEQAIDRMVELYDDLGDEATGMLSAITTDAKRAGLSWSEMAATVKMFRDEGGKTKETNAALKTTFNGLSDAIEKGAIPATATFMEKIREVQRLSTRDPAAFKEFFGGARSELELLFPVFDRLEQKMRDIEGMTGGRTQAKLEKRLEDPAYLHTQMVERREQQIKNLPIANADWQAQFDPFIRKQLAIEAGYKYLSPPALHQIVEGEGMGGMIGRWLVNNSAIMGVGNPEMVGTELDVEALRKQKKTLEADLTQISAGMPLMDPTRGYADMGVRTGAADVTRYAEMYQRRLGRFTPAKYLHHRALVEGAGREQTPMSTYSTVMGHDPAPYREEATRIRPQYQQAQAAWEKANPEASLTTELGRIGADFREGLRLMERRAIRVLNPSHQE
jgi:hypothetical protein